MPKLSTHQSQKTTKMLYLGDSGAGKTGSLAPLVEAGYNLRVLDFDNGLDILVNLLREKSNAEELLNRVTYVTLTDEMRGQGGKVVPKGVPKAWTTAMKLLNNWQTEDEDLGPVSKWTEDDILVVDSFTMMSKAAMHHVLSVNNRLGEAPWINDWGEAMRLVEECLSMLYSSHIACNVIVLAHVTYIEDAAGDNQGYPDTLGKRLPPRVGRYFNTVVKAMTKGVGQSQKRIIRTVSDSRTELKVPAPGAVDKELPLETGVLDLFRALQKARR